MIFWVHLLHTNTKFPLGVQEKDMVGSKFKTCYLFPIKKSFGNMWRKYIMHQLPLQMKIMKSEFIEIYTLSVNALLISAEKSIFHEIVKVHRVVCFDISV